MQLFNFFSRNKSGSEVSQCWSIAPMMSEPVCGWFSRLFPSLLFHGWKKVVLKALNSCSRTEEGEDKRAKAISSQTCIFLFVKWCSLLPSLFWSKQVRYSYCRPVTAQAEGSFLNCFIKLWLFFFKVTILIMDCNKEPSSQSIRISPDTWKIMVLLEEVGSSWEEYLNCCWVLSHSKVNNLKQWTLTHIVSYEDQKAGSS